MHHLAISAESCVFVKQSRDPFHCGPAFLPLCGVKKPGTPSSEVTGPVCRVPKREFARAPEDILLAYLCRFAVRTHNAVTTGIFLAAELGRFTCLATRSHSALGIDGPPDLPGEPPYDLGPVTFCRPAYLSASPLGVTHIMWFRNINLMPIIYAFRPRLRID